MVFGWIEAYYVGVEFGDGRFVDTIDIQVNSVVPRWLFFALKINSNPSFFSEYYWCVLIGRGLGGISVGALHLLIPMYINDIASAEQKPLYHTIAQLQFVIGILSQYILSE